ncbi:hypothetical protein [Brevibacterium sediminis]|uniref:hypothetical protein n=1 Tax=Brevibacterium sediminis TaxID=1857024 RepID=UPI001116FA8F|nr:hypothetical protein [Brevibacterium sediminis]
MSTFLLNDTSQALRTFNQLEEREYPPNLFGSTKEVQGGLNDVTEMFGASIPSDTPEGALESPTNAPVRIQFRAPTDARRPWLACVYTLMRLKEKTPNSLSIYAPGNARPATIDEAKECPLTDERQQLFDLEAAGTVSNGLSMYRIPFPKTPRDEIFMSTSAVLWEPLMAHDDGYERQAITISYDAAMPSMFKSLGQKSLEEYFANMTAQAPSQGSASLDDIGVELVIMPNVEQGDRVVKTYGSGGSEWNTSGTWNSGILHPRIEASAIIENPEKRQLAQTQLQLSIAISGLLLLLTLSRVTKSVTRLSSLALHRSLNTQLIRVLVSALLIATIIFAGTRLPLDSIFTKFASIIIGLN